MQENLARHTRWIVAGSVAIALLWRRDAISLTLMVVFFIFSVVLSTLSMNPWSPILSQIGAIGNALLSKILKRVLKEDRPVGAPVSDPGMPSSHAMSLFFFAAYLSRAAAVWSSWPLPGRAATAAGLLAFAVNSAAWRVSAGLHTRDQVSFLPPFPWPAAA